VTRRHVGGARKTTFNKGIKMKPSILAQLLLGLALLTASVFTLSSPDGERHTDSVQALTEVTGMAFQGPTGGEPQVTALRCRPGQGDECTPDPAIPFSHCQTTIFPIIIGPPCGVAVAGKFCGYETDDPAANDICTSQGAEPGSTCSISSTTGPCVEVRSGSCRSRPVGGGNYMCKCNYHLGNVPYDGRKVCTPGSTGA
jgi:hypothetical protein